MFASLAFLFLGLKLPEDDDEKEDLETSTSLIAG